MAKWMSGASTAIAATARRLWSGLTGETPQFQGRLDDLRVTATGLEFLPGGQGLIDCYWFE
ncbi:MAG: hypothetical protein JNK29_12035, partial [Anaerolineales bacterium]|nr:hypothetical protein [Anaerolineales bacterium]